MSPASPRRRDRYPRRVVRLLRLALVAALLAPAAARAQDARALARSDAWHLYAIEVARSEGVAEARLVAGAPADARVDMSWYFFAALGHGRIVLVDCSSDALARDPGRRASWSVARAAPVTEALARLGLAPADVTDVVLTHHHWDHVEGLARFRRARVHVHALEWARVSERVRRGVAGPRLHAFTGRTRRLLEGLSLRVAGRHTSHHTMVELRCADREVVLAGDAAYLYRNLEARRPVAVTADPARNLADLAAAVERVGMQNVLPGHDPALFARYPSSVEGVAAICP